MVASSVSQEAAGLQSRQSVTEEHPYIGGTDVDGAWRTVEEAQAAKDRVALMRYGATWSTSSSGGYVGVVPATFTPLSPEIVGTEHGEMDA